jgi:nonsense-mediated mRNA decay protein 3
MHCQFSGVVRETPVEETAVVPVRIARGTCDRCGRAAGGYHNAIVQVRASDRVPTDDERTRAVELAEVAVTERTETGDRDAFLTEVDEHDDGLDIKLSATKLGQGVAARITRDLGGEVEEHPTLVTEDEDGQAVYRVTYAVRLPPFPPGAVIDPEDGDGPVLVRSASGNLKGVRLATGDRYEADYEAGTSPDARRLGTVADAVETTVVTVEDAHAVQVLDPETYEARTVPRPDFLDPGTETTPVLKSDAGLHVLPPDA